MRSTYSNLLNGKVKKLIEAVCKRNRPQRAEEQASNDRSAECTEAKGALRGERSYLSNSGLAEVLEAKQHGAIGKSLCRKRMKYRWHGSEKISQETSHRLKKKRSTSAFNDFGVSGNGQNQQQQ
jgi:hypothetical protein